MHIQTALDRFLLQLQADGRSPHTLGQYRRHVTTFARWAADAVAGRGGGSGGGGGDGGGDAADGGGGAGSGEVDVERLTHEHLAHFLTSPAATDRADGARKLPTSTNTLRTSLRCFFRYLHGAGYVEQDPSRLVRRAKCASPPPRALHDDDVEKLLAVLKAATGAGAARDLVLVQLLLGTGIRLGSALALDVDDLDLAHRELRLRCMKGSRPDSVQVDQVMADALQALVANRTEDPRGPVFLGRQGQRLSARHFQRRLAQWSKRAGIRHVSPHRLRHTLATKLYRETRDLLLVKEALRHRSIASTVRYAGASISAARQL